MMLFTTLATVTASSQLVSAQAVHGSGAQGSSMGPAAFMWPTDRPWSASNDNIAPCGSSAAIGNRTEFPLGTAGKVSFSIADESYNIALRIAYGNNPKSQSDFEQFQSNISTFEPGHQCRTVPAGPSSVVAGSNATIQLEYWGNDSGKDESFFACADIIFVEAELFAVSIPCFNVTAEEFTPAGTSPTASSSTPTSTASTNSSNEEEETVQESVAPITSGNQSGGLTVAEKAGIAVAVVVGAFLVASIIFFIVRRKRSPAKDTEIAAPGMAKVASFTSTDAAPRN